MPMCHLRTNMKRSDLPDDTEERMANCIADILGVPLEHVFVMTHCELPAFMAGSREPSMVCEVVSKKVFQNEENVNKYVPIFFDILKDITKLPGKRLVVYLVHVADNLVYIGS